MAAPIGNRFWEQRSSHGRKPIFEDPEQLWEAACEYFEWVTDNPLEEAKAFAYEGVVTVEELPKMRAMTIQGLCFFLDISDETWASYCSKEGFIGICSDIKRVIFTQKFEGASAGLLNASIVARELGLADKQENKLTLEVQSLSELMDEIGKDD
ncbi:DNA-packaging protein [Acinetobacter baumannii]|nr:DNA-packaging protein [Acinetobacter baumannii]